MAPVAGTGRDRVEHIKNPILLADSVRTGSRHVMFVRAQRDGRRVGHRDG
jgi:hypothetical protein